MAIPQQAIRAAKRYGPRIDEIADDYVNPLTGRRLTGAQLLLKLGKGESNFSKGAVSNKGARSWMQFMPGTRQAVLSYTKGKVDPYRSLPEAMHAAVLHLSGKLGHRKGLEGYNPGGGQQYVNYILGQRVGRVLGGNGGRGSGGGSQPPSAPQTATTPRGVAEAGIDAGALLALLSGSQRPMPRSSAGIAPPAHSAQPALPGGFRLPASGGGPAPEPKVDELLSILTQGQGIPKADRGGQVPVPGPEGAQTRPGTKSDAVRAVFEEAARIDAAKVPYLWGGGHAGKQARGSKVTPLDCSGAVSRVLGINPRVSGQFETWGRPGRGRHVTIYANEGHVLMEINGRFWGTSKTNPAGGPGWIPRSAVSKQYLSRFTARHPRGM